MKVSRRGFFSLLGGAIAAPYAAMATAKTEIAAIVEYGWTWGAPTLIDKTPGFEALVRKVIQDNKEKILENISTNNALLIKMKNDKYVKVNYIDIDEQNRRMEAKLQARHEAKRSKQLSSPQEMYNWRQEVAARGETWSGYGINKQENKNG